MTKQHPAQNSQPGNLLLAPFSQEAEEALLGCVLLNRDFGAMKKHVDAEDFYLIRHSRIWETFARLYDREETIDLTTVVTDLEQRDLLDEIGGPAYLVQLTLAPGFMPDASAYARIVKATARRRKLLVISDMLRDGAMDESKSVEDTFRLAQAAMDMAAPNDQSKHLHGTTSITVYAETIMQREADREAGKMMMLPVPDQWHKMEEKIKSFQLEDLVVFAGPSGSGKSAMLECVAEWTALNGLKTSYTHTEMSHNNLMDRRMARHSGLAYHRLLTGDVTGGELGQRFVDAEDYIASFADNISYDWMPNVSMADLAAHWRVQYEAGYRVFCLDHFQDVTFSDKERHDMVAARDRLATWLAAFVEKRHVAVFVNSQLNTQGEIKGGLKLKEKATVLMTIHRPMLTNPYIYRFKDETAEFLLEPGDDSPVVDVTVNKARFGAKSKFKMFYHGPRFGWYDLTAMRSNSLPITSVSTPNPNTKVTPMPPSMKREAK